MTPGQNRVVVLLLVLLGLEAIRIPAIKAFFQNASYQFSTALNQSGGKP